MPSTIGWLRSTRRRVVVPPVPSGAAPAPRLCASANTRRFAIRTSPTISSRRSRTSASAIQASRHVVARDVEAEPRPGQAAAVGERDLEVELDPMLRHRRFPPLAFPWSRGIRILLRIHTTATGVTMLPCRTRPSTSPMETSRSTSAPRSSPATTSRRRSPLPSAATSTSRRAGARASTRSSSGSDPARAARSASSASSSGEWVNTSSSRVETFRVYRGRTGKFVLHIERSADYTMVDAEGKPAGWRGYLGHRQHQLRQHARRVDPRGHRDPRRAPRARSRRSSSTWSPRSAQQPAVEDLDI